MNSSSYSVKASPNPLPLVVGLSHTLIRSSLFWESLALFLRRHILQWWRLPLWLFAGKTALAQKLAHHCPPAVSALPYNEELLAFLQHERSNGRSIVLLTNARQSLAEKIAAYLGLFDHVHATVSGSQLDAPAKARFLLDTYGRQQFDYIGSSTADQAIWQHSQVAYSVSRRPLSLDDQRHTVPLGAARPGLPGALIKALRPRQWLKNLLVFVPMLAAHKLGAATALQSMLAFVGFALCASSCYLLNDVVDAADDRAHHSKRQRPVAAGSLPIAVALGASALLAITALALCALQSLPLLGVLVLYLVSTLGYSLWLKRILMVDIVTLAILYSMRILGGAAATGIAPSFWLLTFSFFIFLSLALLKRHSELYNLLQVGKEHAAGRGYTTADKGPVGIMGINSAFLSVLIFILYLESQNAVAQYASPAWLACIVPLIVFWLGRLWILSYRGQVNEDPVLYVSRDPISLAVMTLCLVLAAAATFPL